MNTKAWAASAAILLGAHALAGTYIWTGAAGDGLWFSIANWDYDGAPATSSPGNTLNGDNVVIDGAGVVVTYVPGGDLITQAGTTITVSNGAKRSRTAAPGRSSTATSSSTAARSTTRTTRPIRTRSAWRGGSSCKTADSFSATSS